MGTEHEGGSRGWRSGDVVRVVDLCDVDTRRILDRYHEHTLPTLQHMLTST
jgi:hypothetical protein